MFDTQDVFISVWAGSSIQGHLLRHQFWALRSNLSGDFNLLFVKLLNYCPVNKAQETQWEFCHMHLRYSVVVICGKYDLFVALDETSGYLQSR